MFTSNSVIVFDSLILLSILLVIFALLPALLSRNVSRSVGWYSLMTGWLVYSISYGLIVGYQEGERGPPRGLCVTQTLLIYAVPQLVATSLLCYYIEFHLIISGLRNGKTGPPSRTRTFLLTVAPWIVFFSDIIGVSILLFPGKHLHLVERAPNHLFCHIPYNSYPIPATITSAVVAGSIGIAIPLEVWTGLVMYWHWDIFRHMDKSNSRIYLTLYIRMTLSTICAVVALMLSMLLFFFPKVERTELCYPIVSVIMAIAFGTQKDILRAWVFWCPQTRRTLSTIFFKRTTIGNTTLTVITQQSRPRQGSLASVKAWVRGRAMSAPLPTFHKPSAQNFRKSV